MYLGLDLGTSNSVIAGVADGKTQVFRAADGGETLPSVLYIDKRGHRLYGRPARDQALLSPENVAMGFKRLMGTATPIAVAGQTLSPEECAAEIVRQLVQQAMTETGEDAFEGAVVAVPAAFNQMQAEATLRAAKLAGLSRVDLIQEPVAAALASMAGAKRSGFFLVYDLGGGTFDAALMRAEKGRVSLVAQQGVNMLGGRDFDRQIAHEIVRPWLLANFDLPETFLRMPAYKRLARISLLAAERAKIELSQQDTASVFASDDEVRTMDQSGTEIFLDAPLTRAQFEALLERPLGHTIDLARALLEESGVFPTEVDRIVFVGGSSRIPLVRRQVAEALGIAADLRTDPLTAVAMGAALYCEGRAFRTPEAVDEDAPDSEPKAVAARATTTMEGLSFDYAARVPDERTDIIVRAPKEAPARRFRLMTEGWDSGLLPLEDGLVVSALLPKEGENVFDLHLLDEGGAEMESCPEALCVTRLVAAPQTVRAAQTLAVKARRVAQEEESVFLPLIHKGDPLPASGRLEVKSAAVLQAGAAGRISFEVFQLEAPEREELNLCVGLFCIEGTELPAGSALRLGDPIAFDWEIGAGGVLRATVFLPALKVRLPSRHFYAPEAAQVSYDGPAGYAFTQAILARAQEEWGELVAAVGPASSPELALLKARIDEQKEILEEDKDDGESVRRVSEEARFIRQEAARLETKHQSVMLQRRLGRLQAAYNRMGRARAQKEENETFDAVSAQAQRLIDSRQSSVHDAARLCLTHLRRLFFAAAWRNPAYVRAWFDRLQGQGWLFSDKAAFEALVAQGHALKDKGDEEGLRALVQEMFEARLSLGASDGVGDPATIAKE